MFQTIHDFNKNSFLTAIKMKCIPLSLKICQWIPQFCRRQSGNYEHRIFHETSVHKYPNQKSHFRQYIRLVCFANKPFCFYSLCGVRLNSLGAVATNRPAPNDKGINTEHCWNEWGESTRIENCPDGKGTVHPGTDHKGPEWGRGIALLFL